MTGRAATAGRRRAGHRGWLAALTLALVLGLPSPDAAADAAGPTDYLTEIVSIDPPTPEITLQMIGGDSFIELTMERPVDVVVLGYQSEDYLRFDRDGSIHENTRSPATWLNQDRYGSEDLPDIADAEAVPRWRQIGDGGRWAWHDHRTHWMNEQRPLGKQPGDQILEAVVPITVNGSLVRVTVESRLLDDPPWWPIPLGALAATAAALLALRAPHAGRGVVAAVVGVGAAALGLTAVMSVPSETQPSTLLWLLPGLAVIAGFVLPFAAPRLKTSVYLDGLVAGAGALLAAWAWTRRTALTAALIPSNAPEHLDRFWITLTLVAGAALAAAGVWGLANPRRMNAAA